MRYVEFKLISLRLFLCDILYILGAWFARAVNVLARCATFCYCIAVREIRLRIQDIHTCFNLLYFCFPFQPSSHGLVRLFRGIKPRILIKNSCLVSITGGSYSENSSALHEWTRKTEPESSDPWMGRDISTSQRVHLLRPSTHQCRRSAHGRFRCPSVN